MSFVHRMQTCTCCLCQCELASSLVDTRFRSWNSCLLTFPSHWPWTHLGHNWEVCAFQWEIIASIVPLCYIYILAVNSCSAAYGHHPYVPHPYELCPIRGYIKWNLHYIRFPKHHLQETHWFGFSVSFQSMQLLSHPNQFGESLTSTTYIWL